MELNGYWIPLSDISDLKIYNREVDTVTRSQQLNLLKNFDKRGKIGLKENAYHVDHMFSKKEGFLNRIPPYIIGSIHNLEMICGYKNCGKREKCSISKEELFRRFFEL